ncbi:MAG: hypothetical protein DI538_22195, partial [Azospira oryzae]
IFEETSLRDKGYKCTKNSIYKKHEDFKLSLNFSSAIRRKNLQENPAERLRGIQPGETKREFLSWKEIEELYKHPCDVRNLKEAFLLSVLTGLRWSDVD